MKQNLTIKVSKDKGGGVVACKRLTIREKLLRKLFGDPVKLTVLVPGDNVEEVEIRDAEKEASHEAV